MNCYIKHCRESVFNKGSPGWNDRMKVCKHLESRINDTLWNCFPEESCQPVMVPRDTCLRFLFEKSSVYFYVIYIVSLLTELGRTCISLPRPEVANPNPLRLSHPVSEWRRFSGGWWMVEHLQRAAVPHLQLIIARRYGKTVVDSVLLNLPNF